jgi:hypothetical protein
MDSRAKPAERPQRFITARQLCCLRDAAAGRKLAPTQHLRDLWGEAEDGAVLHDDRDLSDLEKRGLIKRSGLDRYVASPNTNDGLKLPVRPR